MVWPAADIEVDEALVTTLLAEQHPDLAARALVETGAGWDNILWRLGDDLLVRMPRRAAAAALTVHEQTWLPALAPRLPLPVPVPLRIGRPSDLFPWPWSVVPWLAGNPGDRTAVTDPRDAADRLGRFLRALHTDAPLDAPQNPWRGVGLAERQATFDERLGALRREIDVEATRRAWDTAVATDGWSGRPRWLHGDLHPANLLVDAGTVSAVIDFGDICCGDPATDLAGAWMVLPLAVMAVFGSAYGGVDQALELRSLGWALLFGLMLLAIGLDDRPTYERVGRQTLSRVITRVGDIGG